MELIRKGIEQLRREGQANAQKKVDNAKAFEAKVEALSKHNIGGLYDIRE